MWDRPRPLFQGDQFLTSELYEYDDLHTYKGKVSSQKSDLPCCQKPLQELYHLEVIRILPLAYDKKNVFKTRLLEVAVVGFGQCLRR